MKIMHLPEFTSALPRCCTTNYPLYCYNCTDNTLKINHLLLRYIKYCQNAREHKIYKIENCVVVNFVLFYDSLINCDKERDGAFMTRARGVSQTPRATRHAAGDFRREGNENEKISMHVILDLKLKNIL